MIDLQGHRYLLLEAALIFIAIPLLFYWELVPIPKLVALLLVALYCARRLWKDPTFSVKKLINKKVDQAGKQIFIRGVTVGILLLILIWLLQPEQFLALPTERPLRWIAVMFIYPVLSALPQEFIYRSFFFHRYRKLITGKYATVLASALVFAFLHMVYDNWWAVALSFIAGLLFGITYIRTRSLYWVTVEHVLYGWLVFTFGLDNFFYEPF